MHVLMTSAGSRLAQAITPGLAGAHTVRSTERHLMAAGGEFVLANLAHNASTNLLVRGMDTIVLVGEPLPDETPSSYVDTMTRGTYNLLLAASQEQVRRVVCLSTLNLMSSYGPEYIVTERWRPQPTAEPYLLGKHLGEYVCREFAREHKLQIVVLRLGTLMDPEPVTREQVAPMVVDAAEVVQAVERALVVDLPRWSVFHVQGEYPGAWFPVDDAKRVLGFIPASYREDA